LCFLTKAPWAGGKEKVIGTSCILIDQQQQFRFFLKNIGGPEKGRLLQKVKDFLLAACVFGDSFGSFIN
jgi:hypothetical protein